MPVVSISLTKGGIPNVRDSGFWEKCSELLAGIGFHAVHLSFSEENKEYLQTLNLHLATLLIQLGPLNIVFQGAGSMYHCEITMNLDRVYRDSCLRALTVTSTLTQALVEI